MQADRGLKPIGKRRGEQKFLSEFKNAVLQAHAGSAFWYKLIDAGFPGPAEFDAAGRPIMQKFDKTGRPIGGFRFMQKKPFDVFCIISGQPVCIEAKFHSHAGSAWPFSDVREHQVKGLIAAADAGALSLILLNVRDGLGSGRVNRCYVIPVERYLSDVALGAKSYKWQDLNEMKFLEWKRVGASLSWDVSLQKLKACAKANGDKAERQGVLI